MKKLAVILSAIVLLNLSSCATSPTILSSTVQSETSSTSEMVELTVEEIAEKNHAIVGELNKSYTVPPSGGLSIVSVIRQDEFKTDDKTFEKVIAVEVFTTKEVIKAFWTDHGTITLLDTFGQAYTMITTDFYYDSTNDKIYLLFTAADDISEYKYISIGGLERGKYDQTSIMFEIK